VKYNTSGTTQWAKTVAEGTNVSAFNSVAVNGSGSNVYALGDQVGTGTFGYGGGVVLTGIGSSNALLVKYSN
jgi:hypothetical protein